MNSKPVMAFLREVFLYICCTLASPLWLMWRDDPVVKRVVRVQHVSEKHVCFKYSLLSHTKQALSQQLRDNMLIFVSKRTIKWKTENNVIYEILHFARSVSLIPLTFNQQNSLPRVRSPPLLQPERVLLSGCLFNLTALNSETSV